MRRKNRELPQGRKHNPRQHRKKKTCVKKDCRNSETPIEGSEGSSSEWNEDREENDSKNKEEGDVLEIEDTGDEVEEVLVSSEEDRLKRITRSAKKSRNISYKITSDDEDEIGMTRQGSVRKGKEDKNKKARKKNPNEETGHMDLTSNDGDSESGIADRTGGRGKGLTYKLSNKVDNRRYKIDYGLWTAGELKLFAVKLMEDINIARMKCSKLQGVIDGILKDRIQG